ncbi:MAG: hypothetical protein RMZ43_002975 [Nostoc sp. CmiVER01]|uniref:hypothetical protein n=1 Tax=Nostoc sp. CmiVER01 TaxID=3075384 RepID=UPI002AD2AFDC|nr:hypothetical protein [Nostoc sp. CmiVER01]MDZ8124748.1 hypothetical protein [Nostoc sp. CmiVER01]
MKVKVSLEDDEFYITVWQDGSYEVTTQLNALYYENYEDFLVNIPLDEIPQLLQKT